MLLPDTYRRVRRSIVAFAARYDVTAAGAPPIFPRIFGTGFVVREDGVVVTNDHVVRAFAQQYVPSDLAPGERSVLALYFHWTEQGQYEIQLDIIGTAKITAFSSDPPGTGPQETPDLALVHLNVRGLPTLEIEAGPTAEGEELATSGFLMGSDALTAPGYVHQLGPTLQTGVVSAVLPYPCTKPHGFTLNVMSLGGASGSPVFDPETGRVRGVLYGGLCDTRDSPAGSYLLPTNISYVVPSHIIAAVLAQVDQTIPPTPGAPSIEDLLSTRPIARPATANREPRLRRTFNTED